MQKQQWNGSRRAATHTGPDPRSSGDTTSEISGRVTKARVLRGRATGGNATNGEAGMPIIPSLSSNASPDSSLALGCRPVQHQSSPYTASSSRRTTSRTAVATRTALTLGRRRQLIKVRCLMRFDRREVAVWRRFGLSPTQTLRGTSAFTLFHFKLRLDIFHNASTPSAVAALAQMH